MMAENPREERYSPGRMDMIRQKVARFIGSDPGEVAIVRNTTEGNSLVCQGIDLKAGDSPHRLPGT
jgi:selenocysteine lyase/cysteine desulfurase